MVIFKFAFLLNVSKNVTEFLPILSYFFVVILLKYLFHWILELAGGIFKGGTKESFVFPFRCGILNFASSDTDSGPVL